MLDLLLLAAPIADPQIVQEIAETAAETSGWTPVAVNMVLGTLVALIVAVTALLKMLVDLKRERVVAKVEALAVATDMSAKVERVHVLVNAGDTAHLERIDRLTTRVAELDPTPANIAESNAAAEAVRTKAIATAASTARNEMADMAAAAVKAAGPRGC